MKRATVILNFLALIAISYQVSFTPMVFFRSKNSDVDITVPMHLCGGGCCWVCGFFLEGGRVVAASPRNGRV